jgi:hypothetical protein
MGLHCPCRTGTYNHGWTKLIVTRLANLANALGLARDPVAHFLKQDFGMPPQIVVFTRHVSPSHLGLAYTPTSDE